METARELTTFGAVFVVVLVGFADTTFHALAGNVTFAGVNGAASIVAVWTLHLVFFHEV